MTLTSPANPVPESFATEPHDLTFKLRPGAPGQVDPGQASEKDGQSDDHRPGTGGRGQPSTSDTGSADINLLADELGALARDLERQDDPETMMAAIVTAAMAMIPGAEDGSISVVAARRRVTSHAATSELPRQVDAIQEQAEQGPCFDAAYQQHNVRVDNLATEERWPAFAERASAAGAASMLSLPLYVDGENLGSLNLYARTPGAFTDESEHVGLPFAAHAAIAYAGARTEAQLTKAVASRDLIGQAKGILMERYQLNSERAFLLLGRVSQTTNRKIYDVAAELVDKGTITGIGAPTPAPRRPSRGRTV